MQQAKVLSVLKYIFFFFLLFTLSCAKIGNTFSPFAFGLYFALIWSGQKFYFLAPLYITASLLADFNDITIISSLVAVVASSLIFALHSKLEKPINLPLFCVYAFVSGLGGVLAEYFINAEIFLPLLSLIASIIFCLAGKEILSILLVRGLLYKLNLVEIISALSILCALFCGLSNLEIFGLSVFKLFASFVVLISSSVFNMSTTLLVSCVMGLGEMLASASALSLAPLVIWALVVSCFRTQKRVFRAVAIIGVEIVVGFYLNLYGVYGLHSLLPVVISAIAYVALPKKLLEKIRNFCNLSSSTMAMRNVVNRSRESLCKRLLELGEVFGEMDYVFRSMIKSGMTKGEVKNFLAGEVREKVCASCPERHTCHRQCVEETYSVFDNLINSALERGKTSLLEVPPFLTTRCSRVSSIVSTVNQLCLQYRNYAGVLSNIDASRVLIAEQLSGVSKIMKDLAGEVKRNVSFDCGREEAIISELSYNNIVCSDVVVYEQNADVVSATLIVRKNDSEKQKIVEVVSDVCKHEMAVVSVESSKIAGWNVITMKTAPRFDAVFGTASCPKATSRVSGDCYSIIRISEDKFLLALCDGMGSGEKAEKTSSLAIGLVENFYKAGFDNDIILSSINKLLSLNRDEIFSALDVCVIDTRLGVCDFIKMGAPQSFLKHKERMEEVSGGALPLGIVQEVSPMIVKKVISNGDFVFMFTDGISDSFQSEDALADFLNNQTSLNPQTLAESLIEKALHLSGGAKDDMTVIVAKIFSTSGGGM